MDIMYGGLLLLVVASLVAIEQTLSRTTRILRKADIAFVQYKERINRKISKAARERALIQEEINQYKDHIKAMQRQVPRSE